MCHGGAGANGGLHEPVPCSTCWQCGRVPRLRERYLGLLKVTIEECGPDGDLVTLEGQVVDERQ